jgi:hypothetical protein
VSTGSRNALANYAKISRRRCVAQTISAGAKLRCAYVRRELEGKQKETPSWDGAKISD